MKAVIIISLLFFNLTMSAQGAYTQGMQKAMSLYEKGKTNEAANLFERIGKAEKDKWLPYYYVAQININNSWDLKDEVQLKAQLDKAQEYVDLSKKISDNNPELMILQAQIYTCWIIYDGQRYGMTYSQKVNGIYKGAYAIAPGNPRVVASKAQWDMGSARYFGQDTSPYCKDLGHALELFASFKNETPFYPNWGRERTEKEYAECKS